MFRGGLAGIAPSLVTRKADRFVHGGPGIPATDGTHIRVTRRRQSPVACGAGEAGRAFYRNGSRPRAMRSA
ncbi:MAG TPA: hypothetical protein PKH99_07955 [Vicinamibacterales bacterium]|nr:hypothetical protein [Vicinamibacterales bacterium]